MGLSKKPHVNHDMEGKYQRFEKKNNMIIDTKNSYLFVKVIIILLFQKSIKEIKIILNLNVLNMACKK